MDLAAAPSPSSRLGPSRLYAAGFFLASCGVVLLTVIAVTSERGIADRGEAFYGLLIAKGVLIALLTAASVGRAAGRLMRRSPHEPAPRLHQRFVVLFGIAAVAPVVLLFVFLIVVLSRGVEFWFGAQITTLVESAADVARVQVSRELTDVDRQLAAMRSDLSTPQAVQGFEQSRIDYVDYLREQAIFRNFPAAYVIDDYSTVLARAEAAGAPAFSAPSPRLFEIAEGGDIGVSTPVQRESAPHYVRLLAPLEGYEPAAYVYVVHYQDLSLLTQADAAAQAYRAAVEDQAETQTLFALVYAEAAVLIFAGAIWLALGAAHRVVQPVGRLVGAAEQVRRGDLDVRVDVGADNDELAALGRAFNRMTRQLRSQRRALLEANAEAERRRAFTEAVLAGVSAGVIGLDRKGRISLVNRSAASLLAAEPEALVGRSADDAAPVFAPVLEAARRRPAQIAEAQVESVGPDGAIAHLNVRAAVDEDGELVITFDDVTRLVAAQRNAAWRDVARRIAHEIKNPLTPIQLSAERLKRKYRSRIGAQELDLFDKCVETIVRQVSDIGAMVDEFSAFARMPAPKMEAADLRTLAQSAAFAQRVASPEIKVAVEVAAAPLIVECDSRLASQALANILKNAAESVGARMEAEEAKASGRIAVSVIEAAGYAVIEVIDDGLGWPSSDRSRLTEPYMTTREKGTGLGLAIVRRVMEDHRGRLELDEREDGARGAVVRLAFPLLHAEAGPGPDRDEAAKTQATADANP